MHAVHETIVHSASELAACLEQLAKHDRIGLDTEFVGENSFYPELCLVQVATPERLYLIDPQRVGSLSDFWNLVTDPSRQLIVHAGREEIRICHLGCARPPRNLFDLQLAAGLVGFNYPIGYGGLIRELLEVRLDKHETLTDWRRRPLTPSQVRYAFDDVRFLLPLADKLTRRLHRHHRGEWMVEECASLVRRSLGEEPGIERWRKLKGVASLDRKRLAIVREIYFWRETAAARFNRPARQVLRDDLIAEIARKNPHKVHDIEVIRGIPKREAADILAAVQAARSLPPEQLPTATVRDDDPAQVGLAVGLLAAVLGDVCARQKLAASLVGSNNDLRELVRATKSGRPVPVGNALSQGWRASAVLPHLLDVLQGRRAIRLGNLHDDAPFDYPDVEGSG